VFATRKEAIAARLPKEGDPYYSELAAKIAVEAEGKVK
jgi:hypothetical protein